MSTYFDLTGKDVADQVGKYLALPDGLPPNLFQEEKAAKPWSKAYKALWAQVHTFQFEYICINCERHEEEAIAAELQQYGVLTSITDYGNGLGDVGGFIRFKLLPPDLQAPVARYYIRCAHAVLESLHGLLQIAVNEDLSYVSVSQPGGYNLSILRIVEDIIKAKAPSYKCWMINIPNLGGDHLLVWFRGQPDLSRVEGCENIRTIPRE